jgi:glycosyltransferase involved in cell wall biosynthesis
MKTILSFIDWYLPGYRAGGTLKAFANQIAQLEGVYNFKIITRDTDYCETTPYEGVQSNAWTRLTENSEVYYLSADAVGFKSMKKLVRETDYDAVYVHGIYSFWFSILPVYLAKKAKASPIVVCAHGMLGRHALDVKNKKKQLFLELAKIFGLYSNVVFHAANEAEAQDVNNALGKKARVIVAEELPMKADLSKRDGIIKEKGKLRMCSFARISPEKNTKYALEVLMQCKDHEVIYDIYGPVYNENYWQECQQVIAKLPSNIKVEYKGSLPGDQVFDRLKEYHVMFMPTTGENFGHVILESLMAARPVIISSNTPWRELSAKSAGYDLPLDNKQAFAEAVEHFAGMAQQEYDDFSHGAIEHARAFIANNDILQQNINLFWNESQN